MITDKKTLRKEQAYKQRTTFQNSSRNIFNVKMTLKQQIKIIFFEEHLLFFYHDDFQNAFVFCNT